MRWPASTALAFGLLSLLSSSASSAPRRLAVVVRPDHYALAFDVDLARARFDATVSIHADVERPTRRIVLNAADLDIRDATIGGAATTQPATVSLDKSAETATLTLARPVGKGPTDIRLRVSGPLNNDLRGFYLSTANGRRYAVTQLESSDARRTFPCFDDPALKATFDVTVTVDRGDVAISNGALLSDTPGPTDSRHTLRFATTPRMSTYLVAIAVGDFECLAGDEGGTPLRICTMPGKVKLASVALEYTKQILAFYNGYFTTAYPFKKLDVVAVPDFAAGAMENVAAIFGRESELLVDAASASLGERKRVAEVLAHEIAHQWFGDLVTFRWWDDLWLNEGFATWMEKRPLASLHPDWGLAVDEAAETQAALNLDALKATRPIHARVDTPAQIEESFDVIAYQKGGAVIRMLEGYVGAGAFRQGMNAYLDRYAFGNASTSEFSATMSAVTGTPVDALLTTFVHEPGLPLVEAARACAEGHPQLNLRLRRFFLDPQLLKRSPESATWRVPICYKSPARTTPVCQVVDRPTATLDLPGRCDDWVFVNSGARGYFRTSYAPDMLRALATDLEARLAPEERLSLLGDEWALVRAGRHGVGDYLTLAGGFGHERTSGVLSQLTRYLGFIGDYFTTPATRPAFERFVGGLLRPLYDEVSRGEAPADTRQASLQTTLTGVLGGVARDPDVVARARSAVDRALSGSGTLDAASASTVLGVAVRHGDAQLFDRVAAEASRATSPEGSRYLYALPRFEDPALVARALDLALTPAVRTQDTALFLSTFLGNPAVNAQAWRFVKEHWASLQPKIAIAQGDANFVNALGTFCDVRTRDDIKTFMAGHPLPAVARTLPQTLERITRCIELRARETSGLTDWLASH